MPDWSRASERCTGWAYGFTVTAGLAAIAGLWAGAMTCGLLAIGWFIRAGAVLIAEQLKDNKS